MMDTLLPTTFILMLMTGCCSGQDTQQAAFLNGTVGESVTFTPSLEGNIDEFVWSFSNGSELEITVFNSTDNTTGPGYKDRISVNGSTGSLKLSQLTLNDTGDYTVTLNVTGTIHTEKSTLNVYEKITGANIKGPTEVLIAGESAATLSCQEATGAVISREWLKDGNLLSPSDRVSFSADKSTVSIKPVQSTDNGQYQCILTNPVSKEIANYSLTVNFGPENISISGNKTAEVNSKVEFVCRASSVPSANFTWSFEGTNEKKMMNMDRYTIDNVALTNAGTYTCVASNNVTGVNVSAAISLTVTEPGSESSDSLSGGAIAGIVIGTIGGAGLIGGGGFFAYKKWYH